MSNELSTITTSPAGSMVCSIKADPSDREASAKIYNAMLNPDNRIADFINKKIEVQDYFIEMVELANEETGEVSIVPRVVLISPDGTSYQATSYGIANAVRGLFAAFGDAPWTPPITVEVRQRPTKNGSMLTLAAV